MTGMKFFVYLGVLEAFLNSVYKEEKAGKKKLVRSSTHPYASEERDSLFFPSTHAMCVVTAINQLDEKKPTTNSE